VGNGASAELALSKAPVDARQLMSAEDWVDVCIAEEYVKLCPNIICLCPEAFVVSTLAYSPTYPKINATITIIVRPSIPLPSSTAQVQYIHLKLPGFEPLGTVDPMASRYRNHQVLGPTLEDVGVLPDGV